MPDPMLFVKAVIAAAVAGAVFVLAAGWDRKTPSTMRVGTAGVLGTALAMALGCDVFRVLPRWPTVSVLDRYLIFLMPAAISVELFALVPRVPRGLAWCLRLVLACGAGRVLLHGSSYLDGTGNWTAREAWGALAVGAALLTAVWMLLAWLARRSPGVSLPLALAETILAAGLTVLLSAFPSAGQAGLALGAALAGAAVATCALVAVPALEGALGFGIVGLFGVLMMGRFFGELTTGRAVTIFVATLLCWITELPPLRRRPAWQVAAVRFAVVALPLAAVLFLAQRDFAHSLTVPTEWPE